jgi:hypothetical protein
MGKVIQKVRMWNILDEKKIRSGKAAPHEEKCLTECRAIIEPDRDQVLIGQIALEDWDLLVDCARRRLVPRPESPDMPMHEIYAAGGHEANRLGRGTRHPTRGIRNLKSEI